ncbi:MAG: hypothetical protein WEF86_02190 [Gemmatimonadota bacterium]
MQQVVHPVEDLRLSKHTQVPVQEVTLEAGAPRARLEPLLSFDAGSAVGMRGSPAANADEPESLVFGSLADAEVAADGSILLLDKDYGVVRVLGPDLKPRGVFGRSGGGPGEFVGARSLAWLGPDELAVFDASGQRLEQFRRTDNGFVASGPRSLVTALPRVEAVCPAGQQLFVMGLPLSQSDGTVVTPDNVRTIDLKSAKVGQARWGHLPPTTRFWAGEMAWSCCTGRILIPR